MPRQYPLVPIPQPQGSALQPLADIMSMVQTSRQMQQQQRQDADRVAIDRAFDPVPGQPTGPAGGGYYGPEGQAYEGPSAPTKPRPPTREEVLGRVQGSQRAIIQQHFDDADENAAKVQKARLDYKSALQEHVAGLGYSLATFDGDPAATDLALQQARQTYADDPEVLKRIDQVEAQITANPSPEFVRELGTKLANTNERYAALLKKPAGSDYAQARDRWAAGLGHEPTTTEELGFRKDFEAAGRAPKDEPTSIEGAIVKAQQAGDTAAVNRWMAVKQRLAAVSREGEGPMTASQRNVVERWRVSELNRLDATQKNPNTERPAAEYEAAKALIEATYRTQLGQTAPTSPKAAPSANDLWRANQDAADRGTTAPPTPAPTPPPSPDAGVLVTLPDGRTVRFKTIADRDAFMKAAGYTLAPGRE